MLKIGKIIKGVVKTGGRLLDNIVTGGLIHNAIEETKIVSKKEKVLNHSEKFKIDYPKFISVFILTLPIWLIIALKMGWLTMEEVEFIFENTK